jgi:hypothetical protein
VLFEGKELVKLSVQHLVIGKEDIRTTRRTRDPERHGRRTPHYD